MDGIGKSGEFKAAHVECNIWWKQVKIASISIFHDWYLLSQRTPCRTRSSVK